MHFTMGHRFSGQEPTVSMPGTWTWRCSSQDTFLNGKHGTFTVIESDLPGKLRLHPEDRQQFVFDNGDWFLHIGETGYRYLTDN